MSKTKEARRPGPVAAWLESQQQRAQETLAEDLQCGKELSKLVYVQGHRSCFAKLEVSLIGSGGVYEPVGGGEVCSRCVVGT